MNTITFAVPYYNNPETLDYHIKEWEKMCSCVTDFVHFLIIDDGSKIPAKIPTTKLNISVYRIEEDIPWNWTGVRNLAFTVALTEWVFMTDIDHEIRQEGFEYLTAMDLDNSVLYTFDRFYKGEQIKEHKDTFLLSKKQFWNAKGYDEDYAGWYGLATDMFIKELKKKSILRKAKHFKLHFLGEFKDSQTTTLGRKGSQYDIKNNKKLIRKSKKEYNPTNYLRFRWEKQM